MYFTALFTVYIKFLILIVTDINFYLNDHRNQFDGLHFHQHYLYKVTKKK